jgi:hypothetical protein
MSDTKEEGFFASQKDRLYSIAGASGVVVLGALTGLVAAEFGTMPLLGSILAGVGTGLVLDGMAAILVYLFYRISRKSDESTKSTKAMFLSVIAALGVGTAGGFLNGFLGSASLVVSTLLGGAVGLVLALIGLAFMYLSIVFQ